MLVVDHTQVFTIPANQSMVIRDKTNPEKVVMVVICNFVQDPGLLEYINMIVQKSVTVRRGARVSGFLLLYTTN